MRSPFGKSHKLQHLHSSPACLTRRNALNQSRDRHIFQSSKFRKQLVKLKDKTDFPVAESSQFTLFQPVDFCPVEQNTAHIRLVQRTHDLKQRGLSCPTGPHNAHHFSFINSQINSLQDLKRAETLGYSLQFNHFLTVYVSHIQPDNIRIPQAYS